MTVAGADAPTSAAGGPTTAQERSARGLRLRGSDPFTGRTVSLTDFAGKPVVLNFWASWCPPCREELPALVELGRRHPEAVILGVDEQDEPAAARALKRKIGWSFPSIADPTGVIARRMGLVGMPTTFFLSADHVVVAETTGGTTPRGFERGLAIAKRKATWPASSSDRPGSRSRSPPARLLRLTVRATVVPGYLSFVSGVGFDELGARPRRVVRSTAAFVGGFTVMFVLLGAGVGWFGNALLEQRRTLEIAAGAFLVVAAVVLAGVPLPPLLLAERRLGLARRGGGGLVASSLTGVAFAVGWTPCIGPTLAAILTLSLGGSSATQGAVLLAAYSVGLGVPFLLFGLLFTRALGLARALRGTGAPCRSCPPRSSRRSAPS